MIISGLDRTLCSQEGQGGKGEGASRGGDQDHEVEGGYGEGEARLGMFLRALLGFTMQGLWP